MDNIKKAVFDENFIEYLQIEDSVEAEQFYSKYLFNDIATIIFNCTYNFQFSEYFTFEDVRQDLQIHFWLQLDKIKERYGNNKKYYNLVYSICSRKFIDILRSKKSRDKRIDNFLNTYYKVIAENYDLMHYHYEVFED